MNSDKKTLSQADINETIRDFLVKFEIERNINLFYVVESASRIHGIEVADSDFDLKGIYLPNPSDSLKVVPKIPQVFKIPHFDIEINGVNYDVDVELIDLRKFATEKVVELSNYYDFALFSPMVYVNKYPEIIQKIKDKIKPKSKVFYQKLKSSHDFCEKSFTKSHECLNKRLLTTLIFAIQYFHVKLFNTFPNPNIWEEWNFLSEQFNKLIDNQIITKGDYDLLCRVFDLIKYYYEEKKLSRKSVSKEISPSQYNVINYIETKLKCNENDKESEFTFDFFQNCCDEILNIWINKRSPDI
jgi:hypothetical protein